MGSIVVVGSINMDIVTRTERHPVPGETLFGTELHFIPGGKGENQAIAARRLYDDVTLIGKLGNDAFGRELHAFLKNEHLNLDYLAFSDATPTGVALITVDKNSENTIVVVPASNLELSVKDVDSVPLDQSSIVVSVLEVPQESILHIFQKARNAGAKTILNAAPPANMMPGLLDLTDILVINELELVFFSGSDSPDHIERLVRNLRVHEAQWIVVTLGAKGVCCLAGDEWLEVLGIKVNAIDTTGAGDCFVGALAAALAEKKDIRAALKFANTAAACSVQKLGAAISLPHREEVEQLLSTLPG